MKTVNKLNKTLRRNKKIMLKQLRAICVPILWASMSILPMEKEAADVDQFAQAKKFHERLQRAYHGLL
jgi:hypothetical protein